VARVTGKTAWIVLVSDFYLAVMEVLVLLAGILSGGIAAVSGFGIGSILTPLLAVSFGTKLAVALVAVPHFIGTLVRFIILRGHLDRKVLLTFGLTSAAGGIAGALLQIWLRSDALGYVLGGLLIFAGVMGVTRLNQRLRFGRVTGWIAGALSGMFGGLVGNQGGIRSAAMMGFEISKESFVATATAIGLLVDLFRMPVYAATQFRDIVNAWPMVAVATAGVLVGTFVGKPVLQRIPEQSYRTILSLFILALGIWMIAQTTGLV